MPCPANICLSGSLISSYQSQQLSLACLRGLLSDVNEKMTGQKPRPPHHAGSLIRDSQRTRQYVMMPGKVPGDDIPVPVQAPGKGKIDPDEYR
ncbi:hypothetical protein [Photorhabdus tasmaniensis]|uniref:Uncharacterized protein n=1 Tax=Photorhabdus tasmaniensis TaxID=1004159 RepID=A0ABX0GPM6_9GAMM|nr:hypothetical protein [Photorhabdus tasmaniensis]NHB90116.1 hypothetical protein [Photorhabdus tasmaniensis]